MPPRAVSLAAVAAAFGLGAWTAALPGHAALSLLLLAAALLVAVGAWLEPALGASKELTFVAALGGLGAAGRILFHPLPGVQPLTVIAVAAGAALGVRAGLGVGALGALVSNLVLGQGPWTPWQMLAWAGCGAAGALAAPLVHRRVPFAVLCFGLGFAFSGVMDVWEWYSFYPHTWGALTVQLGRGVWFDVAHATGNLVLALTVGPELRRLLERFGRRLRTEVIWT